MPISDLRRMTRFEDLAEWIEENPDVLWKNAFPDDPMPDGFRFEDVEFTRNYGDGFITFGGKPLKGFTGAIKMSCTTRMTKDDVARMFNNSGIIIKVATSYAIGDQMAFEAARAARLHTLTMRYVMLADEWVILSVYEILSHD